MGAIYLYGWYSRYAPSQLYEGIICGIEKSIISISIGIWREAQPNFLPDRGYYAPAVSPVGHEEVLRYDGLMVRRNLR